jgi:hypothetical protein
MRVVEDRPLTRQPWFWVALAGGVFFLILLVTWAIGANSPDRRASDDLTVVQQPPAEPPQQQPAVIPVPTPTTPQTSTPQPAVPETPAPHVNQQPPQVIHERETIVVEKPVPVKPPTAPKTPATRPTTPKPAAPAMFQDTELPVKLQWDRAQWQANTTTTVAEADRDLQEIGTAKDGHKLFAYSDAVEPYEVVLVEIDGKDNEYVEYRRMK